MKQAIIISIGFAAFGYFINDLGKDGNKYHYDKQHDSIVMYQECCLKCNSVILEGNEKFGR